MIGALAGGDRSKPFRSLYRTLAGARIADRVGGRVSVPAFHLFGQRRA